MTILLKTRDLTRCLLTYEAMAGKSSEPMEFATFRIYEKLRRSIGAFAGVAAFESLAFRALTQAKSEAPDLWAVQVAADGSLRALGEFKPESDIDKNKAGDDQVGEGGVTLIARLLGLLLVFLGETLTLRLLQDAWPDAAFDDGNSGNRRKA
ncbi:MAG TPA: hypothetical protein VK578_10260 [Edaphobacter sp.]|nr:hypothetical protein [Edaphobacter sp.]